MFDLNEPTLLCSMAQVPTCKAFLKLWQNTFLTHLHPKQNPICNKAGPAKIYQKYKV